MTAAEEVHRLAIGAQVYGWKTVLTVNGDAHEVTVTHPHDSDTRIVMTIGGGRRTAVAYGLNTGIPERRTRNHGAKRNVAAVRDAEPVILAAPTVQAGPRGTEREALTLPAVTGCVCCGEVPPKEANLTLTLTGLCHLCALWHRHEGDSVVDPNCQHRNPNIFHWGDEEETERWREDPAAELDDEGSGETLEWLRQRDARIAGYGDIDYSIDEGPLCPRVNLSPYSGRTYLHLEGRDRIDLGFRPARHEVLDLLAIHARRNDTTVDRLRRLLAHENETIRDIARHSPHAHLVGKFVWVETA